MLILFSWLKDEMMTMRLWADGLLGLDALTEVGSILCMIAEVIF